MLTSKMHLSTIFATPLCSSNIRNALTHSSCWAFMSRMIWSGRGMLMPFCPRPHLHCTSWSSGDEQGSNEMTCCASTLAWYGQCWNTHVRRGTRALVTQIKALESLQQRAMGIIFQDNEYMLSLIRARLDTLESRREHLTERFFKRNVLRESSWLHYLLTNARHLSTAPSQNF